MRLSKKLFLHFQEVKLIFYESDDGHKLSLVNMKLCVKIQKLLLNVLLWVQILPDSEAHTNYTQIMGSKIDGYSVKWESSSK